MPLSLLEFIMKITMAELDAFKDVHKNKKKGRNHIETLIWFVFHFIKYKTEEATTSEVMKLSYEVYYRYTGTHLRESHFINKSVAPLRALGLLEHTGSRKCKVLKGKSKTFILTPTAIALIQGKIKFSSLRKAETLNDRVVLDKIFSLVFSAKSDKKVRDEVRKLLLKYKDLQDTEVKKANKKQTNLNVKSGIFKNTKSFFVGMKPLCKPKKIVEDSSIILGGQKPKRLRSGK